MYGRWTQTVAGTFSAGKTIVPSLQIGTIVMPDVVVDTLPFTYENDEHTKVVGLLGFDFIAGGVIKIDYEHGTVDAYRYGFEPPKNALILDAVLDDGVPLIPVSVNGAEGERFILDTGADVVVLFSGFTKVHPAAVNDHNPGKVFSSGFNLVSNEGVGGELHTRALALERVKIGEVTFADFLSEVMAGDQPAFEGEDTDGLIGASVLSAFDVYLDYANSRVAFVLNASAMKHRSARGLGSFH
jgi:aspartyl protease